MAPKRKERESLESLLARPWCYYCDRDFDDLKILHDHQKAKHFHCIVGTCNRRLNTAGGLRVHMDQVHKETLERVPNALPDRQALTPEVFGMEGVPQSMLDFRTSLVIKEYNKIESEWRARTGNPLAGTQAAKEEAEQARKRQRVAVDKEELKRRAAAAKAARALKKEMEEGAKQAGVSVDEYWARMAPEPVSKAELATMKAAHPTPPAPTASPYSAPPPSMPPISTPALPNPVPAPVSASPYHMPPSVSPPGFPMGMYPPPGMPIAGPAFSPPVPMTGYPLPAGLPARVTMPLPPATRDAFAGNTGIAGLPPRPSPAANNGESHPNGLQSHPMPAAQRDVLLASSSGASPAEVDAFINAEYEKSLAKPQQKKAPTVEVGAQLKYSDNILTPEEKKANSPRYRRNAKPSTTQTNQIPDADRPSKMASQPIFGVGWGSKSSTSLRNQTSGTTEPASGAKAKSSIMNSLGRACELS